MRKETVSDMAKYVARRSCLAAACEALLKVSERANSGETSRCDEEVALDIPREEVEDTILDTRTIPLMITRDFATL